MRQSRADSLPPVNATERSSAIRRTTARSSALLLYAGIFLIFSPIGVLIGLIQSPTQPAGWLFGLGLSVFSGIQALAWAWMFQGRRNRFLLLPVLVVFPFLVAPPLFRSIAQGGFLSAGQNLSVPLRQVILMAMGVVQLASGFTLLVLFIRRTEAGAEAARAELEMAARIHSTLVPRIDATVHGWEIVAVSRPSSQMGGDLVDAVVAGGRVDAYLADVSGHGVAAGLVMGMVKSALRMRLGAGGDAPLEAVVGDLNRVLNDLTRPDMFATFAAIRIDAAADGHSSRIGYALAGHLPIVKVCADGTLIELHNECLPLGIEPGEQYRSGSVALAPGDALVIITDGLVEVQDAAGRELGMDAIRRTLRDAAALKPAQVIAGLLARSDAHGRQIDDQSVLVVRRSA